MPVKPQDAMVWLQVVAFLVAQGEVVYEKVVAAYAHSLGKTPEELTADETAQLDVLLATIAEQRAEAQAIADGRA
jgi:hypothetical protein